MQSSFEKGTMSDAGYDRHFLRVAFAKLSNAPARAAGKS